MMRTTVLGIVGLLLILVAEIGPAAAQIRRAAPQPVDPFGESMPGIRSGRRGGGARAMMPASDDDPDLDAALQSPAGKPPSAQQLQSLAVLQQMLGGQPIQRQPLHVLQALIERQKNPAK